MFVRDAEAGFGSTLDDTGVGTGHIEEYGVEPITRIVVRLRGVDTICSHPFQLAPRQIFFEGGQSLFIQVGGKKGPFTIHTISNGYCFAAGRSTGIPNAFAGLWLQEVHGAERGRVLNNEGPFVEAGRVFNAYPVASEGQEVRVFMQLNRDSGLFKMFRKTVAGKGRAHTQVQGGTLVVPMAERFCGCFAVSVLPAFDKRGRVAAANGWRLLLQRF